MTMCLVNELPPNFLLHRLLSAHSGAHMRSLSLSLSLSLTHTLNGVDCSLALWNEALLQSFNEFCPSKKYLCFIGNTFHAFCAFWCYSLFVLLEVYYFLEPNRWFTFKIILLFMAVSAVVSIKTRLYYFLHVLDKRWMGRTYWSYTKMKRKETPRRRLLWISVQK